jgi:hypothetical protein
MEKQWFDTEGAADYTQYKPATLRGWRSKGPGHGPAFNKIRRRVRYSKDALDAFLSQCPRNSTKS